MNPPLSTVRRLLEAEMGPPRPVGCNTANAREDRIIRVHILSQLTDASTPEIAEAVGYVSHTSVLNCRKVSPAFVEYWHIWHAVMRGLGVKV